MKEQKKVEFQVNRLSALYDLTGAYAQIASNRMKATRTSVLTSRDFTQAIQEIFEQVRASYAAEIKKLSRRKRKSAEGKITFLSHNGKKVAVFLAANTGLYGEVLKATFEQFLDDIADSDAEVTVVGAYGRSLFLQAKPGKPYTFFDLPDHGVKAEDLAPFIRHIVQYEEIRMYYGKFESVVRQVPSKTVITSGLPEERVTVAQQVLYIFEPSLEDILTFFEQETFAGLVEQAVREGQLAKHASRVLAMNKAQQNIEKELSKLRLRKLRMSHLIGNRKQLNSLPTRYLLG